MEALQARIESFAKAKRVKNPAKPSSTITLKWPHPAHFTATSESLAEAGFYFNPSLEDRDNVTCYMCDKQLSDWEAQDDPFDIHWEKRGVKCCWAAVRCGLRGDMDRHGAFIFPDKSRLPSSKAMERARLETFSAGDGWMHDQDANHGANSRKMAHAGFVYTPQHAGDDLATCLYSKPASRQSRAASTSKQQHKELSVPTKTHDGSGEDESDAAPPSRRSRAASSSAKGRKLARSQSRTELGDVAEGADEDDAGEAEEEVV
ncbi:Protein bir1, partial [Hypsizygus marmoreus]